MSKKNIEVYRPCVGLCVLSKKKEVFVAHRYQAGEPTNETIAYMNYVQQKEAEKLNSVENNRKESLTAFKDFLWQMPQGGIDDGEDIKQAAQRELYEETGIKNSSVLKISKEWYFYDLPEEVAQKSWGGKYKGQRQKWVLIQFLGDEEEINLDVHLHKEFDRWRWASPHILPFIVVPFKKKVYEAVLKEFF